MFITLLSCNNDETKKEKNKTPAPGDEISDIHPEVSEVVFGFKEDTIVVNTENIYQKLFLFNNNGEWLTAENATKDTVTHSWAKIIALDVEKHLHEDKVNFSISSKKVKIIVFENTTGVDRTRNLLLGKENSGANIKISQNK